jgi:hypothetical protein
MIVEMGHITMSDAAKIDKIYEMVLRLDSAMPNAMTRLECSQRHQETATKVDRIYFFAATVSGLFSFLGVLMGFVAKAKGVF